MTNLDALKTMMTSAAMVLATRNALGTYVSTCQAELDAVAYCDITDPDHDNELARRYDYAVRELQRALAAYDRAHAAYRLVRGRIDAAIDAAILFAAE